MCSFILDTVLEVRLKVITLVIYRRRTLRGVGDWNGSEMLLEPYENSCIVMPILRDKEPYDIVGAVGFLFFTFCCVLVQ